MVGSREEKLAELDLEVAEAFCLPAVGGMLLGAGFVERESPNPELMDDQLPVVCLHRFRI